MSTPVSVYDLLERQDRKIISKVLNSRGRPLLSIMHRVKPPSYENMKGVHVKSAEYKFLYEYM